MKVYISASWKKREQVKELVTLLEAAKFDVFDFTDPSKRLYPPAAPERFLDQFDPDIHVYRHYLYRDEWIDVVTENRTQIAESNFVVLLLPCGIDATADWAYGVGLRKMTLIVGNPGRGVRCPVHLWADCMVDNLNEAVDVLIAWRKELQLGHD